eukprot:GHVQ01001640.1.p1 GENE.GHVQ01001640.1~~GHVQ01001640.1.p1  ORF type:complete len:236 (+),score=62.53 GHVQ01001640.1:131-838(+)
MISLLLCIHYHTPTSNSCVLQACNPLPPSPLVQSQPLSHNSQLTRSHHLRHLNAGIPGSGGGGGSLTPTTTTSTNRRAVDPSSSLDAEQCGLNSIYPTTATSPPYYTADTTTYTTPNSLQPPSRGPQHSSSEASLHYSSGRRGKVEGGRRGGGGGEKREVNDTERDAAGHHGHGIRDKYQTMGPARDGGSTPMCATGGSVFPSSFDPPSNRSTPKRTGSAAGWMVSHQRKLRSKS